mmetsp:Transcript_15089/g.32231  ORF Transcript_15089/g.32231 Transcript_15089/m.32231 type:complete len:443 (+) Transcript_15089:256-1584(+)
MRKEAVALLVGATLLWVIGRNLRVASREAHTSKSEELAQHHNTQLSDVRSASRMASSAAPVQYASHPTVGAKVSALGQADASRGPSALIPAAAELLCTSIDCATRHTVLEPGWVNLSFQPAIDWKAGGVRGDCVAGELEYIMPKYCSPSWQSARKASAGWPSEDRLIKADVHANQLPQAGMSQLAALLKGKTLLVMGDSVMEQFYNTLQCLLRKEDLEAPNAPEFKDYIAKTKPLWLMGKRKKPPKLPQQARTGMRMLYARVTTMHPDEVSAAVSSADVILLNWGLHYQRLNEYRDNLHSAFQAFEEHAAQPGKAFVFQETGAQHFKTSDRRGYRTGEWEFRDKSTDTLCQCQATEDFNVNSRNRVLYEVLGSGKYRHLQVLPFYNLTRPRWRWHFGNCTQRPNGWNYYTCCDCTHFCYSPAMWGAHMYNLLAVLKRASGLQ